MKFRLRLGLLAIVVGALAVTGVTPARQVYDQRRLIEEEKAKLAALTAQNEVLQTRLNRSRDPAYVEKVAREQLGLVRPGETAYVVVPGPAVPVPPKSPPEPLGPWARIWKWLSALF